MYLANQLLPGWDYLIISLSSVLRYHLGFANLILFLIVTLFVLVIVLSENLQHNLVTNNIIITISNNHKTKLYSQNLKQTYDIQWKVNFPLTLVLIRW